MALNGVSNCAWAFLGFSSQLIAKQHLKKMNKWWSSSTEFHLSPNARWRLANGECTHTRRSGGHHRPGNSTACCLFAYPLKRSNHQKPLLSSERRCSLLGQVNCHNCSLQSLNPSTHCHSKALRSHCSCYLNWTDEANYFDLPCATNFARQGLGSRWPYFQNISR